MKKNKVLFVLNIIILVVLLACLVFNFSIAIDVLQTKNQVDNNPDAGAGEQFGSGLGVGFLLVFQIILLIPYAVCLIVSVISLCKKYFNWLSITNAVLVGVAVALTLFVFLFVR